MEGVIIKALSGFYYVRTDNETVECKGSGKLRHKGLSPLVGDRVTISLDNAGKGRIDARSASAAHAVRQDYIGYAALVYEALVIIPAGSALSLAELAYLDIKRVGGL